MEQDRSGAAPENRRKRGGEPPPAEEVVRPRVRSTFEGQIFAAFTALFALAALGLGENLVLFMGCVALGCGQAARIVARRNLAGVRVRRELPARARAGTPVPVSYEVENPRRRPAVGIEVEDRVGTAARPVQLELEFAGLVAGGKLRHTARLRFVRRGRHHLGGVGIASRFPLGFFHASDRVPQSGAVLVRPREGRPMPALKGRIAGVAQADRRPSLTVRGNDVFHGIREFREGDDPRRIHWRTTARRGALTVADWHREEGQEVVVLLGRGRGAGGGSYVHFERAVSAAATLMRLATRRGLRARLRVGRRGVEHVATGRRGLGIALDALALVRAHGGRQPRAALRRLAREPGARMVVFIASGEEPGIRRRLAAAAGPGGTSLLIRADRPDLGRWVGGLS